MSGAGGQWDESFDFVSIGSGIGGFAGAIAADSLGMRSLVVEKAPQLGGVTAFSGGQLWIGTNHLEQRLEIADSDAEVQAYLDFLSGGWAEQDLQEVFVQRGPEALEFFESAGIPWKICRRQPDYHYPDAPGTVPEGRYIEVEPVDARLLGALRSTVQTSPYGAVGITTEEAADWGGPTNRAGWDAELQERRIAEDWRTQGAGLAAAFAKAALVDRNVEAWTSSPVRRLLAEDGEVVGVEVERDGVPCRVRALRGVLIAAGGYDHAPKRLARMYEQRPDWESRSPGGVEGDNLTLGAELGASIATLPAVKAALLGYRIPGATVEGRPKWNVAFDAGFPHAIVVNRAGERFGDESFYRDYQPATQVFDGVKNEFVNLPCYLVVDQSFRDRFPLGEVQPGEPLPEGLGVAADSLDELARSLGIDPGGLTRTVERFNGFVAAGADDDFGRGSRPWAMRILGGSDASVTLGALSRPPFYGIELSTVSSGINVAGLRFDTNANVVHVRGHAIGGLYVAGNSSAHIDIGAGYNSGIANSRGMIWGYVAAQHAARRDAAA